MGYWKAEEYQKFTYPASEYVLAEILPEHNYHAWIMMAHIVELAFSCCRNGWDAISLQL